MLLIEMMDAMKRICGFKIGALKSQDAFEVSERERRKSIMSVDLLKVLAVKPTFFLSNLFLSSPPSLLQNKSFSYATLSFSVVFDRSRGSSSHSAALSS